MLLHSFTISILRCFMVCRTGICKIGISQKMSFSRFSCTCHIKVHLRNYLYTMTKNYLLNMIRDTNDIIAREDMKGTEQNNIIDDGLQEKLEEERKFGYLRWAVKQLPSCKREICLLKIYRGLNNQEIADELNIPINTVKCYYTQSLKLLKYYLRNHVE